MTYLKLNVNGHDYELTVDAATPLVYVLRNQLGLTGTKLGCALEQCGACAVLVDGKSRLACVTPAVEFEGTSIRTIESLAAGGTLNPVQQALLAQGAGQCGYCIPGIVCTLTALWENPEPATDEDIRVALRPHLCRCGSHAGIVRAARKLLRQRAGT